MARRASYCSINLIDFKRPPARPTPAPAPGRARAPKSPICNGQLRADQTRRWDSCASCLVARPSLAPSRQLGQAARPRYLEAAPDAPTQLVCSSGIGPVGSGMATDCWAAHRCARLGLRLKSRAPRARRLVARASWRTAFGARRRRARQRAMPSQSNYKSSSPGPIGDIGARLRGA